MDTDLVTYPIVGFRVRRKRIRKLKVAIHLEYLSIGFQTSDEANQFLKLFYKLCSELTGQNWGMSGHIHEGEESQVLEGKNAGVLQEVEEGENLQQSEVPVSDNQPQG